MNAPQPADGCSSNEGAGGWIEWSGRECPVPGRRVDVKYGNGDVFLNEAADDLNWKTTGLYDGGSDIIAYRVVPSPPASPSVGGGS